LHKQLRAKGAWAEEWPAPIAPFRYSLRNGAGERAAFTIDFVRMWKEFEVITKFQHPSCTIHFAILQRQKSLGLSFL
jgi:hypothetical protein